MDPVTVTINFWSGVLSQIVATSIVALAGAIFLPPIVAWRSRPKMVFYNPAKSKMRFIYYRNVFVFTKAEGNNWDTTLSLSIRNLGNKTIERFYWHIYISKDISVTSQYRQPSSDNYLSEREDGEKYYRYHGYVEMPIFPGEDINFPLEFKIRAKEHKKIKLYYRFNTDTGSLPWYSWFALGFGNITWLRQLILQ
jgi:hypothetical protein